MMCDTVLAKHLQLFTNLYENKEDELDTYHEDNKRLLKKIKCWRESSSFLQAREERSVSLRTQGNISFVNGDYQKARKLYTESLASAIGGQLGAMAYANRCVF